MQKEVENSPNKLLSSFMVNSVKEEEDSLGRELNANVSEQQVANADQTANMSNPSQREASGGLPDESTSMEDTSAQASPHAVQDLTVDE
ncbi:hypothetical protein RHSIM_Rhsim02G0153900 [Rhododendron simsii]|uniref:Uncharacterized protein n=1 Tax=Rhododendron simsii TaxID=118357 RepID=A0A834H8Y1_RHOSS|nr:hypothetical protein RHSIM_Rhsim02G0153900 [Rhododendron simsii]